MSNTLDSHRLVHLAKKKLGLTVQNRLVDALFTAFFCEQKNISDANVLAGIAAPLLNTTEAAVKLYLESDEDVVAVVNEDIEAHGGLAVSGVPLFVFNGQFKLPGAQDVNVFTNIFHKLKEKNHTHTANL